MAGQPSPPADLQPLVQISAVDRDDDIDGGNPDETRHQAAIGLPIPEQQTDECPPVLVLQRVVEFAVPEAQQHAHADQRQVERDDAAQQAPCRPFLLGDEVWLGQPPGVIQERAETAHADLSFDGKVEFRVERRQPGIDALPGDAAGGHAGEPRKRVHPPSLPASLRRRRRMTPRISWGGIGLPLRRISIRPASARSAAARRTGAISLRQSGSSARATSLGTDRPILPARRGLTHDFQRRCG